MNEVSIVNDNAQLKQVLEAIGIKNLYWIDDEFSEKRDDEHPLQEEECIQKLRLYFANKDINTINDLILNAIGDQRVVNQDEPWAEVESFFKEEINSDNIEKVLTFLNEPIDLPTNRFDETVNSFISCLGKNCVHKWSWNDWQNANNTTTDSLLDNSLFLVDYSFKNETNVAGNGGNIVKALLDSNINNSLVFVLTHDKDPGEPENTLRIEICKTHGLDNEPLKQCKLSVVSKKHLVETESLPSLSERLAQVIKSVYLRQNSVEMLHTLNEALDEQLKQLNENLHIASASEIEKVIFTSARKEGASEIDLLRRLIHICADSAISKATAEKPNLRAAISRIRSIQTVDVGQSICEVDLPRQLSGYRVSEIFDSSINATLSPLAVGDIFEYTKSPSKKYLYILIAQECDLIVRDEGKRKTKYVYLLPITEEDKLTSLDKYTEAKNFFAKDDVGLVEKKPDVLMKDFEKLLVKMTGKIEQFSIDAITNDNNPCVLKVSLNAANVHICDINILDWCAFNQDGALRLTNNLVDETTKKLLHLPGWKIKLTKQMIALQEDIINKEKSDTQKSKLEESYVNFSFNNTLGLKPKWINADSFGIENMKRVKRLKSPYVEELVRKFFDYRSRTAFDHDFTS